MLIEATRLSIFLRMRRIGQGTRGITNRLNLAMRQPCGTDGGR